MDLLEDVASEEASGDELRVNERFAKRLKHNKEREERERLERKFARHDHNSGTSKQNAADGNKDEDSDEEDKEEESESDSQDGVEEDENGSLITPEVDAQIFKTIAMIRRKDPELYHREMTKEFFDQTTLHALHALESRHSHGKASKPMTLKEYHTRLLKEDSLGEGKLDHGEGRSFTHAEEEAMLKDEMAAAFQASDDGSDEDLMVPRDRNATQKKEEDAYRSFLEQTVGTEDLRTALNAPQADELNKADEDFLANYILQRGWINKDEQPADFDADEDFEDEVDRFESTYNFRFEQPGATEIVSHSRDIEDSVRRQPEARKRQRESAVERKAAEKAAKREELKRLKNLRRQETEERLRALREVLYEKGQRAAADVGSFEAEDLEKDFDPVQYDKRMQDMFDETWYAKDDTSDLQKPKWDTDIDVGDLEKASKRKHRNASRPLHGSTPEESAPSSFDEETKKRKKQKLSQLSVAEIKRLAEEETAWLDTEQYDLDHEDMIGDLPTKFKYTSVPQEDYGLSAVDILLADDADLNQHVGLRRMAPYRDAFGAQKEARVLSKKARLREFKKSLEDKGRQWDDAGNSGPSALGKGAKRSYDRGHTSAIDKSFEATGANETPLRVRTKKRKGKRERMREQAKANQLGDASSV